MFEGENEFEDFDEGEEEGDEERDKPTTVFVGVGHGGAAPDEAFGIISGVCDRLSLEPLRVSADRALGTPRGDEAAREFLEAADFAIIDLSHKRPTLAREVAMVEAEFDSVFILLVAKTDTPLPAAIEDKRIAYYADKGDLRAVVERQLNAMTDAWYEMEEDDDDLDEDAEYDEE